MTKINGLWRNRETLITKNRPVRYRADRDCRHKLKRKVYRRGRHAVKLRRIINEGNTDSFVCALAFKTADELLALAKSDGIELTKIETGAYIAEMTDLEMDEETFVKHRATSAGYFAAQNAANLRILILLISRH